MAAKRKLRPLHFTVTQRREHLARQLAGGDEAKAARLPRLPLFEVALRGAEALKA